jgi:hypothetical protein
MTERTASTLLISTVLIAILGAFVMPPSPIFGEFGRYVVIAYMANFFAVWFFVAMKVMSKIAPLNFKWESLSRNEDMFFFFYVFLTKEAKEEWRGYINEKKKNEAA